MKLKDAWAKFNGNHPKFSPFMGAVKQRGVPAGTVIEIQFKYEDGGTLKSNLKVTDSDIDLLKVLGSI